MQSNGFGKRATHKNDKKVGNSVHSYSWRRNWHNRDILHSNVEYLSYLFIIYSGTRRLKVSVYCRVLYMNEICTKTLTTYGKLSRL